MKKINYEEYTKPSDFMKFEQGSTTIRIVSEGYMGKKHGIKMGGRYVLQGECKGKNCESCYYVDKRTGEKIYNEPKRYWRWVVYDKRSAEVKLLDTGPMIGNQIVEIAKNNGDPTKYDLEVKRNGTGLKTDYEVKRLRNSVITKEDLEAIQDNRVYIINKYLK